MKGNHMALVIDESPSMRQFVATILREDGRVGKVLEANNPDHALSILAEQEAQLDFIISDCDMPGMSLNEFQNQLDNTSNFSSAAIYLLTGEGEDKARTMAGDIGAHGVLIKPFTPEQLTEMVSPFLAREERRRAQRVFPLAACVVDLGFITTQPAYKTEVINISETGVLIRSPIPAQGVGYVNDVAMLNLIQNNAEPLGLSGRVVRIEADKQAENSSGSVLIAFEFQGNDDARLEMLRKFVLMNNPTMGVEV
jgi:DNA-binding response OmpR family regulator